MIASPAKIEDRNAFVEQNMGLVYLCAKKLAGRGMEFDDLVQAGSVGLIKAADAFDSGRGLAFSTYAVPVILGEMKRLFREGGAVKVGRSTKEKARELLRLQENLAASLGREPGISELAAHAGMETSEAAMLLGAGLPVLSLTAGNGEGPAQEWDLPVESSSEAIADKIALRQVLDSLEEPERRLVECRYFKSMTQSSTAELLGMTQVQVSRKEKAILAKMRGWLGS